MAFQVFKSKGVAFEVFKFSGVAFRVFAVIIIILFILDINISNFSLNLDQKPVLIKSDILNYLNTELF